MKQYVKNKIKIFFKKHPIFEEFCKCSWTLLTLPYFKKFARPMFFYNRSHNHDVCCLVLAGYKEYLWDVVFKRLKKFAPENIDICVVSSGLFSQKLYDICKENGWSYLSTKRNSIPLALNTTIKQFAFAQKIYKIDEDIFVTKNFFQQTSNCYEKCKESEYIPGFVAPLIPVNGYGHLRILKRLDMVEEYTKTFEVPKYGSGIERKIENNADVARFFWGEKGYVPSIDKLDEMFGTDDFSFSVCPLRFSIGAVLFERSTWEKMGYFKVDYSTGMGVDEVQLCSLVITKSQAMIICENTVVGHFSFGKQNDAMKEFFLAHPGKFEIDTE
jgi:hypothetical protein